MSGVSRMRNIGAYLKSVANPDPTNDDGAAAVNGAAIDRVGFDSCSLVVSSGAATGSPTAQTVDAKLQESEDGSTGWTDIEDAAITQIAADSGEGKVDVNLETVKQYIRVVRTVAFTGGTSPAWPVSSTVILGGAVEVPAA